MLTDCIVKARSPDYSSGIIFFLFQIFDQNFHIIVLGSRLKYVILIEPFFIICSTDSRPQFDNKVTFLVIIVLNHKY